MTLTLDLLPQSAFAFILIFARIGAMTMTLPGIGRRSGTLCLDHPQSERRRCSEREATL